MNQKIEDILEICLLALEQGESIHACLARFPEFAPELEPLLKAANKIQALPEPAVDQAHINKLLIEIGSLQHAKNKKQPGFFVDRLPVAGRFFMQAAAILFFIVLMGATTVVLSAGSLPGTPLYTVKLFTEKVQFLLVGNSEGKAELRITFSEKRIRELIETYNRDKSIDRELLNATLNEAKMALDSIKGFSEEQKNILFPKLYHLNAYQNDVLEQISETTVPADKEIIREAIDLCRERGEWMKQGWRKPTSGAKDNQPESGRSPWEGWCRW